MFFKKIFIFDIGQIVSTCTNIKNKLIMSASQQTNSGVQREVYQLKTQGRDTVANGSALSRPQVAGSLMWDPRLASLFVSNGSAWSGVAAWERGADVTQDTY